MENKKLSVNKIALTIIVSIILTTIMVSLVNVGLSIFFEGPDYENYCNFKTQEIIITQEKCEQVNGKWNPEGQTYPKAVPDMNGESEPIEGYCDRDFECRQDWEKAQESYNQKRFYVFTVIGFILLLIGLFTVEAMFQITGLATGGILVFEGIVTNFENKITVFIALLLILIVFGIVAWRIINKYK